MANIYICYQQDILTRRSLAIDTNILYLDNCIDIPHLDNDTMMRVA